MGAGTDLLNLARPHIGEQYVYGATVPKNNPNWHGPWDCAEFVTWAVYQITRKLYGTFNDAGDPATADAYTGQWWVDVNSAGLGISVSRAAGTAGAILLRKPLTSRDGHIVICDGNGGTVEAMGTAYGVRAVVYDSRGRELSRMEPGNLEVQHVYDAAGRRLALINLTEDDQLTPLIQTTG